MPEILLKTLLFNLSVNIILSDGLTTDTEGASFMGGLSSMPAYDDIDHSADELDIELPRDSRHQSSLEPPPPPKLTTSPPDDIRFVSSHYHASSSDEEDVGLPFDERIPNYDSFDRRQIEPVEPSMILPLAAQQLLTNTVASAMQDAISAVIHTTPAEHDTGVRKRTTTKQQSTTQSSEKPHLATRDSTELSDQFEILDQDELSSLEDQSASESTEQPAADSSMSRLSGYGMGIINSLWGAKK